MGWSISAKSAMTIPVVVIVTANFGECSGTDTAWGQHVPHQSRGHAHTRASHNRPLKNADRTTKDIEESKVCASFLNFGAIRGPRLHSLPQTSKRVLSMRRIRVVAFAASTFLRELVTH